MEHLGEHLANVSLGTMVVLLFRVYPRLNLCSLCNTAKPFLSGVLVSTVDTLVSHVH